MTLQRTAGSRSWFSEEDVKFLQYQDKTEKAVPTSLLEALAHGNYKVAAELADQGHSLVNNTPVDRADLLFYAVRDYTDNHLETVLNYLTSSENLAQSAVNQELIEELILNRNYEAISKLGQYKLLKKSHLDMATALCNQIEDTCQLLAKYVTK